MNTYKLNDVLDQEFLRFPLTLLANPKYKSLSLEAKVVYTLLLNRLTLSQRSGWLNEQGEVYLIYPREEAAKTLGITYKKAIAAFKELLSRHLIVERRRGRGMPNLIFVIKLEPSSDSDAKDFSGKFDTPRHAETAHQEQPEDFMTCQNDSSRPSETEVQEVSEAPRTCQNGTSRPAETAVQDMPKSHTSNIYKSHIELSDPSVSPGADAQTDARTLEEIYARCELYIWDDPVEEMFKAVIDRLYYSESCRVGNAMLPREKIRGYLKLLDSEVICAVYDAMRKNEKPVKNTMRYLMSSLINAIFEQQGDMLVCMPPEYLAPKGGSG